MHNSQFNFLNILLAAKWAIVLSLMYNIILIANFPQGRKLPGKPNFPKKESETEEV